MKKIFGIFALLLLVIPHSISQELNLDEIQLKLENHKERDKERVYLLMDYCFYLEAQYDDPKKPLETLEEVISISEELDFKGGKAAGLTLKGTAYFRMSKIDSSIMFTLQAIKIFEEIGVKDGLVQAYTSLSEVYSTIPDYKKALELIEKCLRLIENDPPNIQHARIYYYGAEALKSLSRYEKSKKYYRKAREISEQFNYDVGLTIAETGLGSVLIAEDKYQEGIEVLLSAYKASKKLQLQQSLGNTCRSLGKAYFELKQYNNAIIYLSESEEIFNNVENVSTLESTYQMLSESYEKTGDLELALYNYKRSVEFSDSLFNLEKEATISELLTKYETEKIQLEKDQAEERALHADYKAEQRTQLSIIAAFVALLVIVLLVIIVNRLKLVRKQKIQLDETLVVMKEKTKIELAGLRVDALKSQMNPHFIFNSLNSIQDSVQQEDAQATFDYISLFAASIRGTLDYSMSEFIDIDREVELLRIYLELERLRFGDNFNYSIELNGISQVDIPTFVVQPFIENALMHGLFHKKGEKKLSVFFEMNGDSLTCTIIDNGVGRASAAEINKRRGNQFNSIATTNIETRLELLSEIYKKKFKCEIQDLFSNEESTGTKVILTVPYIESF